MKEECLICKAPLEYLQEDILMECSICHKSEFSKTRCVNGHYVCNECHSKGVDSIVGLCLNETSCDPIDIITGSTPLMNEAWGHSNLMTSRSLARLGEIGGPRCCKRNSYMSILTAVDYAVQKRKRCCQT